MARRVVLIAVRRWPRFSAWISMPQRGECFANRCWMMAKIVDHFYSVDLAAEFLATCHSGKASQGALDNFNRHLVGQRNRNCHGRISDVEFPNQRRLKSMSAKNEFRSGAVISNIRDPVGGVFLETDGEYLAERLRHHFRAVRVIRIDENCPWPGTIFTRRRKLSLISSRFEKISAWSNSILLMTTVSGR